MHCFVPIYKTSKETEEKQNNFTVSILPILRKLLVFIPTSPFTYCGVMLAYIFFSPSGWRLNTVPQNTGVFFNISLIS